MRPLRLEIEGFTSFRERVAIDFTDCDYFVLEGPTGAGKSSIIDAICFGLFGNVPRYQDDRLVEAAISQGGLEARVRLDFAVEGTAYTVVRVVRRNKGTREARLQQGDEVVASGPKEVSTAINSLLGLTFSQFTRCVVLPQGEFARFLNDKPANRQDLIVQLLNLGFYDRMRERASALAATAKGEAMVCEQRLEDFAFATPGALDEARTRARRSEDLKKRVLEAKPRLDELNAARKAALDELATLKKWAGLLADVTVPTEIEALSTELSAARAADESAKKELAVTGESLSAAVAARAALPERSPLEEALSGLRRRAELSDQMSRERALLGNARALESDAAAALEDAHRALELAQSEEAAARATHAASELARALKAGDRCPVCRRVVDSVPHEPQAPAVEQAAAAVRSHHKKVLEARAVHQKAIEARSGSEAKEAQLAAQIKTISASLTETGDPEAIEAQLTLIEERDAAIERARVHDDAARAKADSARKTLDDCVQREQILQQDFDGLRDKLAPLNPPARGRAGLAAAWNALAEWSAREALTTQEEIRSARRRAEAAEAEKTVVVTGLEESCAECAVDISGGDIVTAVLESFVHAAQVATRIEQALEEKTALAKTLADARRELERASKLAGHLSGKPGRFEEWIVNEALLSLVTGATEILKELSSAQYSLTIDHSGDFHVVDHLNAGEVRAAKTLSGGETFLASLALALALSDQVGQIAAEGAPRLEAIFLDEGFGSLDADSLDTVAAAIENLAATGRMVGIITHIRDLAERVPVRFEIRKSPTTSVVTRRSA